MTHEYPARSGVNVPSLRELFPNAAIIRRHESGAYTVFDNVVDAVGHWSATRLPAVSA